MSLFGGSGFLGLKDSKIGKTVSNIGDSLEDASDFLIGLPNKVMDFGEDLGGKTFDTSNETAQKYKDELREFRSRQAGSNVGSFLNDNIFIVIIALLGFFLLKD